MRRFCWLPGDRARGAGVVVTARWYERYLAASGWHFRRALRYPVDGSDDRFVSGSVGAVAGIDSAIGYWTGDTTGAPCCSLGVVGTLDNVIRRCSCAQADLPLLRSLGVIGGGASV